MHKGSCLCGAVRFQMSGPNQWFTHCHCSMCRKQHGTFYGTSIGVEKKDFAWLQGEESIVHYRSSPAFERPFCKHCGSAVPDVSGDAVVIPAGTVEGDIGMRPRAHIFVGSKSPMCEITDQLKQFETYPPNYGTVLPTPAREVQGMQGSCLCGAVEFAIGSQPTKIVQCHCSRCRKSRGATHGVNTFVHQDKLRFLRGADRVREYKIANTMFAMAFSDCCGSVMPALFAPMKTYLVPVGSLDAAFKVQGGVNIYVGSKAPWFDITDKYEQFVELPPRERFAEFF